MKPAPIAAHVGNDYVIDIERMIFNKPHAHLMSGSPYDEIWTVNMSAIKMP